MKEGAKPPLKLSSFSPHQTLNVTLDCAVSEFIKHVIILA
jgi:hypothetical protein